MKVYILLECGPDTGSIVTVKRTLEAAKAHAEEYFAPSQEFRLAANSKWQESKPSPSSPHSWNHGLDPRPSKYPPVTLKHGYLRYAVIEEFQVGPEPKYEYGPEYQEMVRKALDEAFNAPGKPLTSEEFREFLNEVVQDDGLEADALPEITEYRFSGAMRSNLALREAFKARQKVEHLVDALFRREVDQLVDAMFEARKALVEWLDRMIQGKKPR